MTAAAAAGVVAVLAGAVALLLTPLVRAAARRRGLIAQPSADRWHERPTALVGGIAIAAATLAGVLAWLVLGAAGAHGAGSRLLLPALAVGFSAAFMCVVGLVDDLTRLRPQLKFNLQLLAGIVLVAAGGTLTLTPWHLVNVLASLFWFVALTNAFNLLDNMDGVAAGVGAIAATFLGITFALQDAWLHAAAAWALAGATLGFLRYNFSPASIFMGDTGSLFIGSLLAGLVMTSPASVSGHLVAVVFVPLAIMAVPIVDTALVTVTRTLAARAISQGGRDHSAHRLVALGLRERQVALLLYAFAAAGGVFGLLLTRIDHALGLMFGALFLVALTLLAAYLGRMKIAYPDQPAGWKPATVVATALLYKRRLAVMLLDVALVALAYYGAFRLRFEDAPPVGMMDAYRRTLWLVIAVHLITFQAFRVYRGAWRYISIGDVFGMLGAIATSALVVFGYAFWRVPALVGTNVLWIFVLLAVALTLATRASIRSLEQLRRRLTRHGKPVAIYGAGDHGELVARELMSNAALGLVPLCFLDDDPNKRGERIHGVPVVGGLDQLLSTGGRSHLRGIVIATRKLPPHVLQALVTVSRLQEIELLEVDINVRSVRPNGQRSTDRFWQEGTAWRASASSGPSRG